MYGTIIPRPGVMLKKVKAMFLRDQATEVAKKIFGINFNPKKTEKSYG